MGVFDAIRAREDRRTTIESAQAESFESKHEANTVSGSITPPAYVGESETCANGGSDAETSSLEAREDKEIRAHPDEITAVAHAGLQKAEAVALVWNRPAVIATYAWIWICFFMLAFHQTMGTNLINYVLGDFAAAPQVTTSYMLANIVGGVLKLPLGKTLNLWGRAEGLLFSLAIYLVGMIILAACNGPNGFAAGYVLYWIGYYCLYLILDIFVADTSGLRNRAFAFGFVTTPFICTAFTAPLAANHVRTHSGWRWGYGIFAIVQFFVFIPLAVAFKFYEKKARRMGVLRDEFSGRTRVESIIHYFHEFDVIGAFIVMAAFILFLLPFSLASYGLSEYNSPTFIAMVVVGFCLFFVFAAWEKWCARTYFIRYELFKKRTILGACVLSAVLFFSFELWDTYLQQFLRITYNIDANMAGYILQIYNVGSCFWSPLVGLYIRTTKHFKYLCLCFGMPFMILGSGLMIYFRGSEHGIGYVIMCQIFIAFAGGTLVIGEDMAVMAGGDREGIPMMLALIGLFANIGGAIGLAVTAAIYSNVFLPALANRLPPSLKSQAAQISLDGLGSQVTFPVGSPIRDALVYAWGYNQKILCIASTCILVLGFPAIVVWKNYNVDRKQNKGTMI